MAPKIMKKMEVGDTKGLPPAAVALIREATRAVARGDLKTAERSLTLALVYSPQHPETLRLLGVTYMHLGRHGDAVGSFRLALLSRPADVKILMPLAQSEANSNDVAAAIKTLRLLVSQRVDVVSLYTLATMLDRHGAIEEAQAIAERIVGMDSSHAFARILFARCLLASGCTDEAAAQYRYLIRAKQEVAKAWYGLAEIKTMKLSVGELVALKAFSETQSESGTDLVALKHALGKGLEDIGDYSGAFSAFTEVGRLQRSVSSWNPDAFREQMAQTRAAFAHPAHVSSSTLGDEVIFIVGLPRSGSTLVEQIIAAHPEAEGASELPDLNAIIQEESIRQRLPFPKWVKDATAADWKRLGETYLLRTARWREKKPRSTDKLPENWTLAEAALMMLPGAHVIDCRRDALETCWSCFKQIFAPGRVAWSYSFGNLASYWQECRRHTDYLARQYPNRVRIQSYEALIEDTEGQTRELLKFCGLEFNPACLRFYEASRSIRTASAAQVREPIRADTARTEEYGSLLDTLRTVLAHADMELRDRIE